MINALSVDVEEYFHPAEVTRTLAMETWPFLPSRIEAQVNDILDLLDRHSTRATFFLLGWVAEHTPAVARRIVRAGHEIGCHSYAHRLVYTLTPEEFRKDTLRALEAIEDATGVASQIYRAPSYSITRNSLWALDILVELGLRYDSSILPIWHDRYGIPGCARYPWEIATANGTLIEIPVATAAIGRKILPVGGGAYMRLLPYRYTAAGIRQINVLDRQPACIYFHPWEIDPHQPRVAAGLLSRLRTYVGLGGMMKKLDRLLGEFRFSTIGAVYGVAQPKLRKAAAAGD